MTDDVWEARMQKAMTRHNTALRWLSELAGRTEDELKKTRNKLEEIILQMEREIEDSKNELTSILSRRNDPVVYVRNYNETTVYVYHGSLGCGRLPYQYREMLLGDARDGGLQPCYSCGHLASRPTAA